jgi:hypothetical protein
MPIYAVATFGPLEKPNKKAFVEILGQIDAQPPGRFLCQDLIDKTEHEFRTEYLELCWLNKSIIKT